MPEDLIKLIERIFLELRSFLLNPETLEKSRLEKRYFTRSRKFNFVNTVLFLLADFPGSLDTELREYFECLGGEKEPINESAISQSRNHINQYPFEGMFEIVRGCFLEYNQEHPAECYAMLYCGVDGSCLNLPDFKELAEFFGTIGKGDSPTARISIIFDSLQHFIYDAVLENVRIAERDLALEAVRRLGKITNLSKFTFIFDRGYPGLKFFETLVSLKTHFIVRSRDKWYGLDELDTESSYKIHLTKDLTLRVIKLSLSNKQQETLITNLFRPPASHFKELYNLRWPVEVEYYVLKHVIRLEDFNGYTINSIKQNFWIAVTFSNLASLFRMAAQALADKQRNGSKNKYYYQVNISESISLLHTRMVQLLIEEDDQKRERCIEETIKNIAYYVIPVRENRIKKREMVRKVFYHFNRKVH